ncbi:hypothetical protein BDR26DRAFT_842613 [Obelidium mucronatum]|nr:hypothetical protein BDR26DRAFT_842613 [Obelidium mucronatum]
MRSPLTPSAKELPSFSALWDSRPLSGSVKVPVQHYASNSSHACYSSPIPSPFLPPISCHLGSQAPPSPTPSNNCYQQNGSASPPPFGCTYSSASLEPALARMHNNRPQCPHCSESFSTTYNLQAHIKSTHFDDRPFHCTKCPAKFSKSFNLKRHETLHSGQKPFQCAVCNARFTQRGHWRSHILAKHRKNEIQQIPKPVGCNSGEGAVQVVFVCGFCGDRFASRGGLEFHSVIHV